MVCKKLEGAIKKVSRGYSLKEVTEEYSVKDGEMKLTKKKETVKDIPPDLKAVKLLLGDDEKTIGEWSDEELEKEKARLLKLIKGEESGKSKKGEEGV